jgi:hypothetical protein
VAHQWPTFTVLDCAPPEWSMDDPAVEVFRTLEGKPVAYGHRVDGVHWLHLPAFGSFRFAAEGNIGAIPNTAVSQVFADAYRRVVLPLVMQSRGWEVLHASGAVFPAGVVAFCGVSGTGKSTTATGLGARGYPVWADDVVPIEIADGRAHALSVPFRVRLLPDAISFFANDCACAAAQESFDATAAPLAAICLLERRRERGPIRPPDVDRITSAEALSEILIHAYFFSPKDSPRNRVMIENYLELCAAVPILRVRFTPGLVSLPGTLDAIEQAVSGATAARASSRSLAANQ